MSLTTTVQALKRTSLSEGDITTQADDVHVFSCVSLLQCGAFEKPTGATEPPAEVRGHWSDREGPSDPTVWKLSCLDIGAGLD